MIMGAIAAFVSSLIFSLTLPAILGVVLAALISGLTVLDPLYAGERIEITWAVLKAVLIFQALHTFITAPIAGALIGYLRNRIRSGWLYVAGVVLTIVLHYLFSFLFIVISSFRVSGESYNSVGGISILLITLSAPLIGLVSVFASKRWGK